MPAPSMREMIAKHRILAVLRGIRKELLIPYVRQLHAGGIGMVEIAMNVPDALPMLAKLCEEMGDELYIGAGTVLTEQVAADAAAAGAQFLLAPSANPEVMDRAQALGLPMLPGVMTPTEVSVCLAHGCDTMKLFPAGDLPANYIRSLKGPFDRTEYVAFGGVTRENIGDYFARGFLGVGVLSGLFPQEWIGTDREADAAEHTRALLAKAP